MELKLYVTSAKTGEGVEELFRSAKGIDQKPLENKN